MRPLRLRIEGFTSFREPVEVNFADVELAGIVGPTGSGKSSILDALTFALYGSAARIGQRDVAPAITLGCTQAKLSLDFEVAGQQYTATRVVRRTPTGASTKEVRLERGDEVLAGAVAEMNAHIEHLLGLDFEQFTKTVVLPQGQFATFLNDTPGGKQELLRRLLGMEVYQALGAKAADMAKQLKAKVETIDNMLEAQAVPSKQEVRAKKKRVAILEGIVTKLGPLVADASQYASEMAAAEEAIEKRGLFIGQLESLEIPKDAADLGGRLELARRGQLKAEAEFAKAREAAVAARKAVSGGPDARELELTLRNLSERENADADLQDLRTTAEVAADDLEASAESAANAKGVVDHVQRQLVEAERLAGATAFIQALEKGEACPVCDQIVSDLPSHQPDRELARAKKDAAEAEKKYKTAEELRKKFEKTANTASANFAAAKQLIESLDKRLATAPTKADAQSGIKKAAELAARLSDAEVAEGEEESAHKKAVTVVGELVTVERELRKSFGQQRDELAELTPPEAQLESLTGDWADLSAWGNKKLVVLTKQQAADQKQLQKVKDRKDKAVAKIDQLINDAGDPSVNDPIAHFETGLAVAQTELTRMEDDVQRFEASAAEVEKLRTDQRLHEQLRTHLKPTGFERWLMEEAMVDLVDRATERLLELSGGQYSLVAEKTTFRIIDHRNADEVRDASTLSGGETFLASLALALALSDNIAEMASEGAPALEAIFLDEGFGTLDPDTLDVVAAAMEELGASGRMVAVITHIRDLAERMPVRFEVAKVASTSTVTRVDV